MGGQFDGSSLEPPARVSCHVTGVGLGRSRACSHLLMPGVGAYRAQVFPSPSPSCRSPLQGLILGMGSTRALSSQRCLGPGCSGIHCPASTGWSSVVLIIGAVATGHALSLVPRGRFSSLGVAAPAGRPVLLGAGGAAGLGWDGLVGAVFAEAEFPVSPPFFLGAEASVLHALRALVSLLFVDQRLLPICLGLGRFWFRGALRWSDPWCGLLGRFADLGFWREISDWGFPGLPGVRCLPWRQLEGISRNLWFCIGHAPRVRGSLIIGIAGLRH